MSASMVCRFPDEPTAIAVAAQLGTTLTPGTLDAGDENFALHVFDQWDRWPGTNGPDDSGLKAAGFWVNVAFNLDTEAGSTAYQGLIASGFVVNPATITPSNTWA